MLYNCWMVGEVTRSDLLDTNSNRKVDAGHPQKIRLECKWYAIFLGHSSGQFLRETKLLKRQSRFPSGTLKIIML